MIQDKKTLDIYIEEDLKANGITPPPKKNLKNTFYS